MAKAKKQQTALAAAISARSHAIRAAADKTAGSNQREPNSAPSTLRWDKITAPQPADQPTPKPKAKAKARNHTIADDNEAAPGPVNARIEAAAGTRAKLSQQQRAVLEVLINPAFFGKPNRVIGEACGIDGERVRRIKGERAFRDALQEALRAAIQPMLPAILDATFRSAQILGREGYGDRVLLLEMGDLYKRRRQVEQTGTVQHEHSVASRLTKASALRERQLKQLGVTADDDSQAPDDDDDASGPVIEGEWHSDDTDDGDDGGEPEFS